jgi:hypothetical protein
MQTKMCFPHDLASPAVISISMSCRVLKGFVFKGLELTGMLGWPNRLLQINRLEKAEYKAMTQNDTFRPPNECFQVRSTLNFFDRLSELCIGIVQSSTGGI